MNNLDRHILPAIERKLGYRDYVLQQDNAPTHSCNLVYNYLNEKGVQLLIWPPKCPMFNIIENCWSILQRRVNQLIHLHGQPRNDHTLFRYGLVAWRSIQLSTVLNLYNSLPNRINAHLIDQN